MTQINPDLYDSDPFDMKKSKFYIKDNRPLIDKVKDFGQSLLFWKGRKKGSVCGEYSVDVWWEVYCVLVNKKSIFTYLFTYCVITGNNTVKETHKKLFMNILKTKCFYHITNFQDAAA